MSRKAMSGVDREAFIKAQIISVHKVLNKNEVPLKQKHVRVLIVGTHKEKSSSVFWNTISRIQLEKNPVLTWKFCHLLHKLIRDGHPKVVDESIRYSQRIVQLGNFWQHLHSSGYGLSNTSYCRMLVERLEFHKRNHTFPGSLQLTDQQLSSFIDGDVNVSFELSIEMLDQMDNLLNLQTTVFNAMDVVRWSSLVPQGQCLLAPLILVIVDTSKFYDYLVKMIFKLHSKLPPDALAGHRERFNGIFRKMKKFYEEATNLQYFKYLVSIPSLPSQAPNFLMASDLDTYQTPQAVLHGDNTSESETPPDSQSLADEHLVDISEPTSEQHQEPVYNNQPDLRGTMIESLRQEVEDARLNNERLMNEARSRIEQYENRLLQMKHENDHYKQSVDEMKEEMDRLREANTQIERQAVDEARLQDVERRAQNAEQNFQKMKNAYGNLRTEHIEALTKLSNAQKDLEASQSERINKDEEILALQRKIAEMDREKSVVEEKARGAVCSVDDLQGQLAQCQVEIENLNKTIEDLKDTSTREADLLRAKNQELQAKVLEAERDKGLVEEKARCAANSAEDLGTQLLQRATELESLKQAMEVLKIDSQKRLDDLRLRDAEMLKVTQERLFESSCKAIERALEQSRDDLQSATSISYPIQLALPALRSEIETVEKLVGYVGDAPSAELVYLMTLFGHNISQAIINCAAAAYTVSIQHYEPVYEKCRAVAADALRPFVSLRTSKFSTAKENDFPLLKKSLEELERLCSELPTTSGDVSAEEIGSQLEEEMKRMDAAIKNAVAMIEEIQKQSRANDSGIRLEVNEKILDSCNALMAAIVVLVAKGRAMQDEIVSLGRGTASPTEFYKRNHQWTEGLLSAAKAVGVAATVLVQSAEGVVTGKGKFEHLIVASQEIAASTAQLFVSSRVKADRDSKRLAELSTASRSVNTCTARVVATVKSGQETLSDSQNLDFSHLTLHEAKKEEMESQVRVLELEAELTKERARFAQLRKQHYHLASLVANENGSSESAKEAIPH